MKRGKLIGLLLGGVAFVVIPLLTRSLQPRASFALAVLVLMMIWWFTEAIPIHWTAMVPLALYPLLGVTGVKAAALPYVDGFIFLFMGGMVIAAAMEQSNLHRRIALTIMRAIGTDPKRLLLGVIVATAFISLWISNTATATMMFPIGMALIAQLETDAKRRLAHYGCAVMLAIAYAANIGGIGTMIGTAPNAQFCGFVGKSLGVRVGFLEFLLIGFPFVALFLPLAWLAVWRVGRNDRLENASGRAVIDAHLASIGPMKRSEKLVLGVFVAAAAFWIASGPVTRLLGPALKSKEYEALVAMTAALALTATGRASWASIRKVPWSTLLLLGGSFSMAAGIEQSGLSAWAGGRLGGLSGLPPMAQIAVAAFVTVFISAFASNTATIAIVMPILAGLLGRDAFPALAAATIATSCDFMLPAGTPPNAIVFGSGYVTVPRMMKTGFLLDVAAAALATLWVYFGVRHFGL